MGAHTQGDRSLPYNLRAVRFIHTPTPGPESLPTRMPVHPLPSCPANCRECPKLALRRPPAQRQRPPGRSGPVDAELSLRRHTRRRMEHSLPQRRREMALAHIGGVHWVLRRPLDSAQLLDHSVSTTERVLGALDGRHLVLVLLRCARVVGVHLWAVVHLCARVHCHGGVYQYPELGGRGV